MRKRPPSNADIEEIRKWRREYMRLYRRGQTGHKMPAKRLSSRAPGHYYRHVSYYLDKEVLAAVHTFCKDNDVTRNIMIAIALDKFFGHRRFKHEIRLPDTPFTQKKFMHDRIECRVYDKVDEFTKTFGKYERQSRITTVIEQAIRELVLCNVQYPYGVKLEFRNERKTRKPNS